VRWQRHAQIAVGVVGIGVAVALVVTRRDRPVVTPPPPIGPIDPTSLLEGGRGTHFLVGKGGTRRGTLTYESSQQYEDGRMRFTGAVLSWLEGEPFTLKAGEVETKGKPNEPPDELRMSGGTHFETPSGLRVDSDQASYRDGTGVLSWPGAVTFAQGRLTGRGVGAAYRREARTLALLAEATVTVAPDPAGKGAVSASAGSMVLNRVEHAVHLDGSASVRVESQSFTAARASLFLTDDEQTPKSLRLLGGGRVAPVAGSASRTPSMQGEAIDLLFHPDGRTVQRATLATAAVVSLGKDVLRAPWIDLELAADGATVTSLASRDGTHVELAPSGESPARTIDARTLSATGAARSGLTAATFDGGVTFVESAGSGRGAAPPLKGTSRTLVLALAGDLGAVEAAEFLRAVEISDGVVAARADAIRQDVAKNRLDLRTVDKTTKQRPSVEDDRVRLSGDTVEVNIGTHDVRATGNAETRTRPQPKAASEPSALFDRSKAIQGTAVEVAYVNKSGRVTYTGNARQLAHVFQEKNDVKAEEIVVEDASQNLSARRRVDTTLELAGPLDASSRTQPTIYRITSDELEFDHAARRATFRGAPADLRGPDERAEGRTIEFRLAADSRTVSGFVIAGNVFTRLSGGQEASGDRLVFDAATGIYTLTGSGAPALVKTPPEEGSGPGAKCMLHTGLALEFDRAKNVVRGPGGAMSTTDPVACDRPIRR
jgi:lipopolysaccharide export system protein LptA